MFECLSIIGVLATGIGLGLFFYLGLHWTVSRGLLSQKAALWFFFSMLIRTAVVILGFWLISYGHWERAVICLVGFVAARFIAANMFRLKVQPNHAP